MQKSLFIIMSIFLLFACTMPETRIYSIYVPIQRDISTIKTDDSIAIVVHAPRHLTQPYISYRNSPYQLEISKYSKWDTPPSETVRDRFKDSLSAMNLFKEVRVSRTVPTGFYLLTLNLKKFERYEEGNDSFGELLLDVDLFSPELKELYHGTISKKVKLDDRSFLSLAKGLSDAIKEGIHEARDSIIKSLKRN